jgi:disulfide bond formation protein DsbB
MTEKPCPKCLLIRAFVFAILLGGGAGYWAAVSGAGMQLSMLVTFFGAMLPVMWYVKKKQDLDE